MAECHKCKGIIRGESGIKCEGVCGKIYHSTAKCSDLDQYSNGILNKQNFIRFMCDDCVQYIQNIDEVLCSVQNGVQKNQQQLNQYKHEFETSLKHNEMEIKQLLEAIEKRYDERIKKLDKAFKMCEKNIEEIRNLNEKIKNFEDKNNVICNSIESSNIKMCDEIKKAIKESSAKTNQMSYAETVKSKMVLPVLKTQKTLIVKPKEKQGSDKTKEDLNKKVNPINLKITSVENRRNGSVVIQSETDEEREKIKKAIQSELNDGYEIKVASPIGFKIKITDITFKYDDMEIIEKLNKQNPMLITGEIKILGKYEVKRNNGTIYNVILKVDIESYTKMIAARKINLGWERCSVFDGTNVLQCLKCKGYNHVARDCKNEEACLNCHGNHKTKDCKKEKILKCINCSRMNLKLNLGLDEKHLTNDKKCQVYLNKLNIKKREWASTFNNQRKFVLSIQMYKDLLIILVKLK